MVLSGVRIHGGGERLRYTRGAAVLLWTFVCTNIPSLFSTGDTFALNMSSTLV